MATTASIVIEVDDSGPTKAFQRINAEAAKLGPTLQPVQHISEQTFNNIEHGALKARESAALLGEEFGVKIPRALRGTIAESALIGPAFTAAFNVLAVTGFIAIAVEAGKKIAELVDHLAGWREGAKETMDAQTELNNMIIKSNEDVEKLQEAYRLIGLQGLPLISEKQKIANEKFDEAKKKVSDLTAELAKLQKQSMETHSVGVGDPGTGGIVGQIEEATAAAESALAKIEDHSNAGKTVFGVASQLAEARAEMRTLGEATKNVGKEFSTTFSKEQAEAIKKIAAATQEASARLQEMTSAAARGGLSGEAQITAEALAQMAAVEKLFSKEPTLAADAAKAIDAIEREATRKRITLYEGEWEKKEKILQQGLDEEARFQHEQAEKQRRMEDETISAERAAAIAVAPPWERANATIIANYEERMAKIRELVKTGDKDEEHAARMETAAMQELYAQRRDLLASQMEGLYDDITSGNIKKRFLDMFKHMVFQMVATWILGMQQMRSASQQTMNGGGGILGAIFGSLGLGGIFGGGGGVFGGGSGGGIGPGGTPPFIQNLFGDDGAAPTGDGGGGLSLAGIGLSAGLGVGGPGTTLPAGSGPGGIPGMGGPLAGILGKIFSHGAGPLSGGSLAMLGIGLLGATFRGGGILNALGGAAGGALTGFSIGGPIGAVIGGIVGFFTGLLGHSTKKARLQIEANIKAQSQKIEDAYNLFQMDWSTSRDQLEQLRQQGVDALRQAGVKDISRSRVGHVDHWIDLAEKDIDATQAERNRRGALAFGPAQFRIGGFVGPGLGGSMPSWFAGTAMHFAGGGAVPAILHEGEFVMRPEAVHRIGRDRLDSMNSGGNGMNSGGNVEIHNHFQINALDMKSFSQALSNGAMDQIMWHMWRGRTEGRW
jgi:hypothetical protein